VWSPPRCDVSLNFFSSCDKTTSFSGHQITGRLWPLMIYCYLFLAAVHMTHKRFFSPLIDKEEADRPQEQNFTAYARMQSTSVRNIDESYRYQWQRHANIYNKVNGLIHTCILVSDELISPVGRSPLAGKSLPT
jgi:hypothetical protein